MCAYSGVYYQGPSLTNTLSCGIGVPGGGRLAKIKSTIRVQAVLISVKSGNARTKLGAWEIGRGYKIWRLKHRDVGAPSFATFSYFSTVPIYTKPHPTNPFTVAAIQNG